MDLNILKRKQENTRLRVKRLRDRQKDIQSNFESEVPSATTSE